MVEERAFSLYATGLGDSPVGKDGRLAAKRVLRDAGSRHL